MELLAFLALLFIGYLAGSIAEARHYASIKKREAQYKKLPAVTMEDSAFIPGGAENVYFVSGCCVVSIDYFKKMLAALRNIAGGRIRAYETLVDRGRREAVLRMKKLAADKGCDIILNMRIETSSIGNNAQQKNGLGSIEIFAYGTAVSIRK